MKSNFNIPGWCCNNVANIFSLTCVSVKSLTPVLYLFKRSWFKCTVLISWLSHSVLLFTTVSYMRFIATTGKEKTDDTRSLLLSSIALGPAKDRTAVFYSGKYNWESIRSCAQRYRIKLYYVISQRCLSWLLWRERLQSLSRAQA